MDGRPAVLKTEFLKPLLHERSVPIICVYAYWVTKENLFHILGHIQKCEKKFFVWESTYKKFSHNGSFSKDCHKLVTSNGLSKFTDKTK